MFRFDIVLLEMFSKLWWYEVRSIVIVSRTARSSSVGSDTTLHTIGSLRWSTTWVALGYVGLVLFSLTLTTALSSSSSSLSFIF